MEKNYNEVDMECKYIDEDDDLEIKESKPSCFRESNDNSIESSIDQPSSAVKTGVMLNFNDDDDEIKESIKKPRMIKEEEFDNKELVLDKEITEKKVRQGEVENNYWKKLQSKHAKTNKKGAYNTSFHFAGDPTKEMEMFNHEMGSDGVGAGSGNITGASAGDAGASGGDGGCCEGLEDKELLENLLYLTGFEMEPGGDETFNLKDTCDATSYIKCKDRGEILNYIKPYFKDFVIIPLQAKTKLDFEEPEEWVNWYTPEVAKKYPHCKNDVDYCKLYSPKAVNKHCAKHGYICPEDEVARQDPVHIPVTEATVGDTANQSKDDRLYSPNDIKKELDHFYNKAVDWLDDVLFDAAEEEDRHTTRELITYNNKVTNPFNLIIVGQTGAGKTTFINDWAKSKGVELVEINVQGDPLDFTGIKDIELTNIPLDDEEEGIKVNRAYTTATKTFDAFLTGKPKILFLDEINKADQAIVKQLLTLISFHKIVNGDDVWFLPKLLFVVGAMNPSNYGNREELDPALKMRFVMRNVVYDTESWKDYTLQTIKKSLERCQKQIDRAEEGDYKERKKANYARLLRCEDLIKALTEIKWAKDDEILNLGETELTTVPRVLSAVIDHCDGTKIDFLTWVNKNIGPNAFEFFTNLLSSYADDPNHKANNIWNKNYKVVDSEKDVNKQNTTIEKAAQQSSNLTPEKLQKRIRPTRN